MFVNIKSDGEGQTIPDIKSAWIFALRSGKYEQALLHLRSGSAYCCLGVLCLVAGIPIVDDGTACGPKIEGRNQDYGPIRKIVGLAANKLMEMNDLGASFPEIADWIDTNIFL